MYQTIFDLISQYVFGGVAELTASQLIAVDLIATTGCLLVLFIPFYLVYRIIKMLG